MKKTMTIDGMSCENCSARLERMLNAVDGVSATVDFSTKKAQVEAPHDIDDETLFSVVKKAGYKVVDIKAS